MMTVQICPNCKRENSGDAGRCIQCGASLADKSIETIRVADFAAAVRRPEAVTPPELRPGVLALYVMGEKAPILVEGANTVTLGRVVFGEPAPTVDLTEYHGRLLGVSRHHAAIHMLDAGFSIEDLDSSNGTWLNDTRLRANQLAPLHNGDLLRLGQLVLSVYFQDAATAGTGRENNGEEKPRTPTRPLEFGSDIRGLSVTLTGRPGRVDIRPDGVRTTMLYAPEAETLPEGTPPLFTAPRFYTVHIPTRLWRKIEAALSDPHDQIIIEGTCAYDSEAGRIAILATGATSKHLEAKQTHLIARQQKRLPKTRRLRRTRKPSP